MNEQLAENGHAVNTGAHTVLIIYDTGSHSAGDLVVPNNITQLAHAPELNLVKTA